jgi:hypothetical protein
MKWLVPDDVMKKWPAMCLGARTMKAQTTRNGRSQKKEARLKKPVTPRAVGASKKIPGNVKLDATGGQAVKTKDGVVQVNLAKYILRPLTEEDLEGPLKNATCKGKRLTLKYYECVLFSSTAANKHPRFIQVGEKTGNLMKHCRKYHEQVLTAVERQLKEFSSKEAGHKISEFVRDIRPPIAPMGRFFARKLGPSAVAAPTLKGTGNPLDQISFETLLLVFGWKYCV